MTEDSELHVKVDSEISKSFTDLIEDLICSTRLSKSKIVLVSIIEALLNKKDNKDQNSKVNILQYILTKLNDL